MQSLCNTVHCAAILSKSRLLILLEEKDHMSKPITNKNLQAENYPAVHPQSTIIGHLFSARNINTCHEKSNWRHHQHWHHSILWWIGPKDEITFIESVGREMPLGGNDQGWAYRPEKMRKNMELILLWRQRSLHGNLSCHLIKNYLHSKVL